MDKRLRLMIDLIEPLMVRPGSTARLSRDHDPGYTGHVNRQQAAVVRGAGRSQMAQPPGNRGDPGAGAARDQTAVPRPAPAVRAQMMTARDELVAELGIVQAAAEEAGQASPH